MIPSELKALAEKKDDAVTIPACIAKLTIGTKEEGGVYGELQVMMHKALRETPAIARLFAEKMRVVLDEFEKGLEAPND